MDAKTNGALRVWWIPQVPGRPFLVSVPSVEAAALILGTLAQYDIFQLENRIKPDYCNAGGLEVLEGDEWEEWYSEEGESIDDVMLSVAAITPESAP